jgi:hypothetical protein
MIARSMNMFHPRHMKDSSEIREGIGRNGETEDGGPNPGLQRS